MRRTMMGLATMACVGLLATGALAKTAKPDATVKLTGKSVGAGIGWSWGKGTLTYKGNPDAVVALQVTRRCG